MVGSLVELVETNEPTNCCYNILFLLVTVDISRKAKYNPHQLLLCALLNKCTLPILSAALTVWHL
ncbi:MAG: hypothetical protein DYG89_18320 [Caldilinea sp. CFX5]|nr:hypothetical protein [Caldilinea sp. CFX5]